MAENGKQEAQFLGSILRAVASPELPWDHPIAASQEVDSLLINPPHGSSSQHAGSPLLSSGIQHDEPLFLPAPADLQEAEADVEQAPIAASGPEIAPATAHNAAAGWARNPVHLSQTATSPPVQQEQADPPTLPTWSGRAFAMIKGPAMFCLLALACTCKLFSRYTAELLADLVC